MLVFAKNDSSGGWRLWLALVACGLCHTSPLAQTLGDVQEQQEVQRQQDIQRREAQQRDNDRKAQAVHSEAPETTVRPPVLGETPCAQVDVLDIHGPSSQQFQWLQAGFAPFAGQCLGAQSIEALLANLNDSLKAAGYVTSRVEAAQPQTNPPTNPGVLRLELIAGRIGRFRLVPPAQEPTQQPTQQPNTAQTADITGWPDATTLWMAMPSGAGGLLNLRDLDHGAETIQRLPGYALEQYIVPQVQGSPGLDAVHDVVVPWQPAARHWGAQLSLDNSSSPAMGRTHLSGQVAWHNLLGLADQTSVYAGSNAEAPGPKRRSLSSSISFSVPLGYHRLSWVQSNNRSGQGIQGTTINFTSRRRDKESQLQWQWTAYRDAHYKITTEWAVGRHQGSSQIEDVELVVQRRHASTRSAGLSVVWVGARQQWQTSLNLTQTYRRHSQDDEFFFAEEPVKASTLRLTGYWSSAVDLMGKPWAYSLQWDALRTRHPTPLSDVISLGGRYSVRGFTGDRPLSASDGVLLRHEWQAPARAWPCLDCVLAPYLGLDMGKVWGTTAPERGRWVAGAALGVRGRWGRSSIDFALAMPLHGLRNQGGTPRPAVVPYLTMTFTF